MLRIPVTLGIGIPKPLFISARISITPGAQDAIEAGGEDPRKLLDRHFFGDWGNLSPDDAAMNNAAVSTKDRILSSYLTKDGRKIYVITDPGHETTTVLLPEEY